MVRDLQATRLNKNYTANRDRAYNCIEHKKADMRADRHIFNNISHLLAEDGADRTDHYTQHESQSAAA